MCGDCHVRLCRTGRPRISGEGDTGRLRKLELQLLFRRLIQFRDIFFTEKLTAGYFVSYHFSETSVFHHAMGRISLQINLVIDAVMALARWEFVERLSPNRLGLLKPDPEILASADAGAAAGISTLIA